jgi:hypothetical protein
MKTGDLGNIAPSEKPKCKYCGAEAEGTHEVIGFKCEYCGEININIKPGYLPLIKTPKSVSVSKLRNTIREFLLREVGGKASIYNIRPYVLPIWRGYVKGDCYYRGYKRETRTRTRKVGKKTYVETYVVYIPMEGFKKVDEHVSVSGKIDLEIYALDEILDNALKTREYIEPEEFIGEGWRLLAPELMIEEAREKIDDEVEDSLYRWATSKMTEVFELKPRIKVEEIDLIFYPIIEFNYLYRGRRYKGVADAVKNMVIRMEKPLKPLKRVLYGALAYTSIGIGTFLSTQLTSPAYYVAWIISALVGGYLMWRATAHEEVYD